jgi:tight adherence protein B
MDQTIPQYGDFSGILRQQETFAVEGDQSLGNRINRWFDDLMLQCGWGISPGVVVLLSVFAALLLGGMVFVWQENLISTAMATFFGFLIPPMAAMVARSRRQTLLSEQLSPMIDELARAAKTGRSLESCLTTVANDTPAPLGTELKYCTQKLSLGLNIDDAMSELPRRTGVMATTLLITALGVHRQTGGDLVHVLERLAQAMRDRVQFQGRLRAATAASRATAILMVILPPIILTFFIFRDPEYLTRLMSTTWGMRSLVAGFILEFVGAIWVWQILNRSART